MGKLSLEVRVQRESWKIKHKHNVWKLEYEFSSLTKTSKTEWIKKKVIIIITILIPSHDSFSWFHLVHWCDYSFQAPQLKQGAPRGLIKASAGGWGGWAPLLMESPPELRQGMEVFWYEEGQIRRLARELTRHSHHILW